MKKLLFTLGIFLHTVLCLPIQAETATIDSLKRELQLAEQKNSTKEQLIELYQFLGAEYETLDHDSSYHYIQKGVSVNKLLFILLGLGILLTAVGFFPMG